MKNQSEKNLTAIQEIQNANTDNGFPNPLVGSFKNGKTAAFQCFLLQHLAQAQHSFENLAASNDGSDVLTAKVATALFNKISRQILSTQFGSFIRKTSAEAAIEHMHGAAGVA